MKPRDILGLFIRIVIGAILIYSGASKAIAPSAEFAAALAAYKILPLTVLPLLALIWPWIELLTGTYLVFGYYTRLFAGVSAGMFLIFLSILTSAMLRKIDPGSCGCFGMGLSLSLHQTATLDSILLVLSLLLSVIVKSSPPPYSTDSWITK